MEKHTPGMWRVWEKYEGFPFSIVAGPQEATTVVAFLATNNDANAHLIAAAPDLLAALEEITKYGHQATPRKGQVQSPFDDYIIAASTFKRVKEAIAKAKGETQ